MVVLILLVFSEETKATQWDHPKFDEIKQRLDDCNYIKYASYRVASKFRILQNALFSKYLSFVS